MNTPKNDGNPNGNVGALFLKCGAKSDYFLLKVTVKGENFSFVCFPNENKDFNDEEKMYDKNPAYFIFPYKPKEKNGNE